MTDEAQAQFDKWIQKWDSVVKQREANLPEPGREIKKTSYYHDLEEFPDQMINDGVAYGYSDGGYGKQFTPVAKKSESGNKAYLQNPIHYSSVGSDQEDENGHLRVSNNWTDGKELRELSEIKKQVEILERKVHDADVLDNPKERAKLQKELDGLRTKVKELSAKLESDPRTDLA